MSAAVPLREDFNVDALRHLPRRAGMPGRAGVFWRWQRSTMVATARTRPGSERWACRRCAIGCWPSTPMVRFDVMSMAPRS